MINVFFRLMQAKTRTILFLAAIFSGCLFLAACQNKLSEVAKFNQKDIAREEGKAVVIQYSVGGKRKAILTGPLLYRVEALVPYMEFPKSIHVNFYDERDSVESTLDARYARYKETESKVFLKDSVRVVNIKGDTLHCQELNWDRNRVGSEFYTDKPVRIRTKMQIINGVGMEASQDFKEYHIIQATGILKVPAEQLPN